MQRRDLLCVVTCFALSQSACATHRYRPPIQPSSPDTARACADWRWIGMASGPEVQCPNVPGWTVRPLFGKLPPVDPSLDLCDPKQRYENIPEPELIQELNRFCVYEITDRRKKLKDLPFPPSASTDLVRFDRDCAALSLPVDAEMESADMGLDREQVSEHLLKQAGHLKDFESTSPPGVRLAFLDTQPTDTDVPPWWWKSPHGFTLAHIGQSLACQSKHRCAARITTQLALPLIEFDPENPKKTKIDLTHGGYLGLQSHLAEAIEKEVDSWWSDLKAGGAQRHLVLNLSLAWDGELFGGLNGESISNLDAGTQAVYRALEYASGFDALILAAAGNQKKEPCPNYGPLLPAAWERRRPQDESCREDRKTPLLYAVGGVKSNGDPLYNARPGGMPRRAAYGENAIVPNWNPKRPIALYTGSSVATAVASSIAAVAWNFFPHLSSHDLMAILDTSGEELYPADFWFNSHVSTSPPLTTGPRVHRLSLCSALKEACASESSPVCSKLPYSCEPWTHVGGLPPGDARQFGSCQPWVYPQPPDPPFPNGLDCKPCPP